MPDVTAPTRGVAPLSIAHAHELMENGAADESLAVLEVVLARSHDLVEQAAAFSLRADIFQRKGQHRRAARFYARAIDAADSARTAAAALGGVASIRLGKLALQLNDAAMAKRCLAALTEPSAEAAMREATAVLIRAHGLELDALRALAAT